MRNCTWAGGADRLVIVATCVLQRRVRLFVAKMGYVCTMRGALLYNTQWHDDTPSAVHLEECCEALLHGWAVSSVPVRDSLPPSLPALRDHLVTKGE